MYLYVWYVYVCMVCIVCTGMYLYVSVCMACIGMYCMYFVYWYVSVSIFTYGMYWYVWHVLGVAFFLIHTKYVPKHTYTYQYIPIHTLPATKSGPYLRSALRAGSAESHVHSSIP